MNDTTSRRVPTKKRAQKKPAKRRPKAAAKNADDEPVRAAVGTLTRTKSLLLAALRVWELKQGIRD
ncbi:MAG: hypothetical protein ABI233_01845 [Chthoniobacterales bacterium]